MHSCWRSVGVCCAWASVRALADSAHVADAIGHWVATAEAWADHEAALARWLGPAGAGRTFRVSVKKAGKSFPARM